MAGLLVKDRYYVISGNTSPGKQSDYHSFRIGTVVKYVGLHFNESAVRTTFTNGEYNQFIRPSDVRDATESEIADFGKPQPEPNYVIWMQPQQNTNKS